MVLRVVVNTAHDQIVLLTTLYHLILIEKVALLPARFNDFPFRAVFEGKMTANGQLVVILLLLILTRVVYVQIRGNSSFPPYHNSVCLAIASSPILAAAAVLLDGDLVAVLVLIVVVEAQILPDAQLGIGNLRLIVISQHHHIIPSFARTGAILLMENVLRPDQILRALLPHLQVYTVPLIVVVVMVMMMMIVVQVATAGAPREADGRVFALVLLDCLFEEEGGRHLAWRR